MVVIGTSHTNVSLRPVRGPYPVEVLFHTETFNACFGVAPLIADPAKELERLYASPNSEAQLVSEDAFFIMNLKHDSMGHIAVDAEARRYGPPRSFVRLEFDIDQTYLPSIIADLKRTFPSEPAQ